MNKVILLLIIFVQLIVAKSSLVTGYGVSDYDVPIINYGNVFSHNFFVGINNYYEVNQTNEIVISGIFSTNRRHSVSFLNELELQLSFKKYITDSNAISVGFHVAHLLSENVPEVDLLGTGFGIHLDYTLSLSNNIDFTFQAHSTSYGVLASTYAYDRFSNQTIRSFISFSPN